MNKLYRFDRETHRRSIKEIHRLIEVPEHNGNNQIWLDNRALVDAMVEFHAWRRINDYVYNLSTHAQEVLVRIRRYDISDQDCRPEEDYNISQQEKDWGETIWGNQWSHVKNLEVKNPSEFKGSFFRDTDIKDQGPYSR